MLKPKNSFRSVVTELAEGLREGTLKLRDEPHPLLGVEEQGEQSAKEFHLDERSILAKEAPERKAMRLTLAADRQDVFRVVCEGDITLSDLGVDRDPLQELLDTDYTYCFARKVILNLEKAKYIDSSGVSWLIRLHKRFQEQGGMLVVHSIPPLIRNVLNLIRVDVVFHIAENEAAAKAMAVSETV